MSNFQRTIMSGDRCTHNSQDTIMSGICAQKFFCLMAHSLSTHGRLTADSHQTRLAQASEEYYLMHSHTTRASVLQDLFVRRVRRVRMGSNLIFGRFISTRSSDFNGGQGYKLAYFTVKFDHNYLAAKYQFVNMKF